MYVNRYSLCCQADATEGMLGTPRSIAVRLNASFRQGGGCGGGIARKEIMGQSSHSGKQESFLTSIVRSGSFNEIALQTMDIVVQATSLNPTHKYDSRGHEIKQNVCVYIYIYIYIYI